MSPNCQWCDTGAHEKCTEDWCECRQNDHGVNGTVDDKPATLDTIPIYAMLDLWMALGFEPNGFEPHYANQGYADTWAWLLAVVRKRQSHLAEAGVAAIKENGDPLYVRAKGALDSLHEVRTITVDVARDEVVRNARGDLLAGTLEATITIVGAVR